MACDTCREDDGIGLIGNAPSPTHLPPPGPNISA
jgi:hypothetical protein